jgi:CRP/FNR family transcriptional regulator, cyclic AMP receptor protein
MQLGDDAAEKLRDIGLFGGLSDETLKAFAGPLEVLEIEPGTVIYRERDNGREMFVVLEGIIEVLRTSKRQHEMPVATVRPGMWFGEKTILDVMPRPSTARASTAARLLRITAHDLDVLYRRDLKSYTLVVLNIAREISRQLRVVEGISFELLANMMDEYLMPRG